MSRESSNAAYPWRSQAVLMELSRAIQKPCSGELLYAVPALLKSLEIRSPGVAADKLVQMMKTNSYSELEENRFPLFKKCCRNFLARNALPRKKDSAMKLIRHLLENRASLKESGVKSSTLMPSIRMSAISMSTAGGRAKKTKKRMNIFARSKGGRTRASTASSTNSFLDVDNSRASRNDAMDMVKSERLLELFREASKSDLQIVLIFILSPLHNKQGIISHQNSDHLLALAGSPLFKNRYLTLNNLVSMAQDMLNSQAFNVLVLEEFISFIWRNSTAKHIVGKALGKLIFSSPHSTVSDHTAAGQLLTRLIYSSDLVLPTKLVTRHRIWCTDVKILKPEDVVESLYCRKSELVAFYKSKNENRYAVIVDQLFELYKFKDIVIGVYNKYSFVLPEWRSRVRGDLTAMDIGTFDVDDNTKASNVKNFRARYHGSSSLMLMHHEREDEIAIVRAGLEEKMVNEEVDFNERLRKIEKELLSQLKNNRNSKVKAAIFGKEFYKMLDASTKVAVRLEVLNLVRKPIKGSLDDMSRSNIYGQKDPNPRNINASRPSLSRAGIMCEIYLDCLESLYHGFVPFILVLQRYRGVLQAKPKREVGSGRMSQRPNLKMNFKGGLDIRGRLSGRNKNTNPHPTKRSNKTQPPAIRAKLSAREGSQIIVNRSQSLKESRSKPQKVGKLGDANNKIGKGGLRDYGSVKAPKKTRRKKDSQGRTGSLLSSVIIRPKTDVVSLFEQLKETEECFSEHSLLSTLEGVEGRFDALKKSFDELRKHVDTNDPVKNKIIRILAIIKEMKISLKNEMRTKQRLKRTLGHDEVEKRFDVLVEKVDADNN